MQALIQRVLEASVESEGREVGAIGPGLLVLVCAQPEDTVDTVERLLAKILKLRVFSDADGKMNLSLQDIDGGLLLVSQFTLVADLSRGNRPSFAGAAAPDHARALYERMVARASELHRPVASGVFAADMKVRLVNDGPVTIPLKM